MTHQPTPSPNIIREPAKIIAEIIQKEMDIPKGFVVLTEQKVNIPPNHRGLWISINDMGGAPIGVSNKAVCDGQEGTPPGPGMTEIQEVAMHHVLQIDILSFDGSARVRKEEIPMSLASIFAKNQMEKYCVQIAQHPTPFINTSDLEETERLERYTTETALMALHRKEKPVLFYDKFRNVEVHTND